MPRARGLPPAAPGDDGSPATVTGAHYRLHVAKRKKRDRRSPPLQVAVFAYPSLDLTHACELVKTGVIYGDSVRLISPTATLLAGIAAMANPDRTQLPAVVRMMLEVTGRSDPSVLAGIATWENLIRKRARNAAELNAVKQAERQMQTALVEMRDPQRFHLLPGLRRRHRNVRPVADRRRARRPEGDHSNSSPPGRDERRGTPSVACVPTSWDERSR